MSSPDSFAASGSSPTADFLYENHGSIFLLYPLTPSARSWIAEHLPDDVQLFRDGAVIEPRYVHDIIVGAEGDGLEVARG